MLGFKPLVSNALTVNHAFKRASGSLAVTLGDVVVAESGYVIRNGSASLTLDGISISATGALSHVGSASIPLSDIQIAASGNVLRSGALSLTLDSIGVVATGADVHAGPLSVALADASIQATGLLGHVGSISINLDDIQPAFSGTDAHQGTLGITLDDVIVEFVAGGKKLAAGYPTKSKRNFVINGKRMSLLPHELDAELIRLVEERIESPAQEPKEKKTEATVFKFEPLGFELDVFIDQANREQVIAAMRRIEAERMGAWIEMKNRQHEEETVLMLLLAA